MIKDALFHAKILLFGEYGIIQDSMGLSIPYKAYRGELTFKESVDGKDVGPMNNSGIIWSTSKTSGKEGAIAQSRFGFHEIGY